MKQKGFTLIETLIAIFLLTLTVGGLLEMAAGGYFAIRYARNQIVANNLMQESLEYIRNDRDTAIQSGIGWDAWLAKYTNAATNCTTTGCIVDPYATGNNIRAYRNNQPITFFPSIGSSNIAFYGYSDSSYNLGATNTPPFLTSYKRVITVAPYAVNGTAADQAVVTSTITWSNGNSSKSATQSILLTDWQLGS